MPLNPTSNAPWPGEAAAGVNPGEGTERVGEHLLLESGRSALKINPVWTFGKTDALLSPSNS